jgi:hypothetical protein
MVSGKVALVAGGTRGIGAAIGPWPPSSPALADPAHACLKALPVWRREDGLLPSRRWPEWPAAATVSGRPWCR